MIHKIKPNSCALLFFEQVKLKNILASILEAEVIRMRLVSSLELIVIWSNGLKFGFLIMSTAHSQL